MNEGGVKEGCGLAKHRSSKTTEHVTGHSRWFFNFIILTLSINSLNFLLKIDYKNSVSNTFRVSPMRGRGS
jgi:hypothetical protein